MLSQDKFIEKIAEKKLSAGDFYSRLSTPVQDLLFNHLANKETNVGLIYQLYQDYGYTGSLTSVRYFFYHLHDISPEHNRKKQRPFKVDLFRTNLEPEQDCQLMEIVEGINPRIEDIHKYLTDLGYDGSWNSTRNWYLYIKKTGEKAKVINQALVNYQGINHKGILYKLLADGLTQMDQLMSIITNDTDEDMTPSNVVKVLPSVLREVRSCVELIEKQDNITTIVSAEKSMAAYIIEKLLDTFKEEAHIYQPLKTACDGLLEDIANR